MKLRTNAISNIGECVMCAWNGARLWNRALKVLEFGKKKKKEKVPNQKSCTKHVGYQKGYH